MEMKGRFLLAISTIAGLVILAVPILPAAQEDRPASQKAEDAQPWKLSIGTNLVIVPVIVRDKHGDHVAGMRAEDFEIKEDGAVQKIVHLDEVSANATKVEKTAPATGRTFGNTVVEQPKRLVIIALDQINTAFQDATDGHRMMVDFLSKSADHNTLIALVALQHNGIRIIHNFTNDPSVLVTAVQKVRSVISSRDTHSLDTLGDNSQADIEALQLIALLHGTDVTGSSSMADLLAAARANSAVQRAQIDASRQAQESLITLEDFQQLAQYFWGVPGRKSLIWASTGFPFSLGSSAQSSTRGTLPDDWQRTFRMLADANVSVYPVDIGGLVPGANPNNMKAISSALATSSSSNDGNAAVRSKQLDGVDSGAFIDPNSARHDTMRQLADMTGGQAFYNSNDVSGLFRLAGGDAAQYYMLSYYTKSTAKAGWRKLSVKAHRDNVKLRARSGFFFHDPGSEPETARQADEMMAMVSDLDFTAMPLTGVWKEVEPAGNNRKAHFLLSVPAGVPSIDNEHQNHINFDFRAVALDSNGRVVAKLGERLETNLPPENLAQIQSRGLDYANSLTLAPGQYKIHFVVRDNLKGTMGSVVVPLKVE
jgi:VWFA-related protein